MTVFDAFAVNTAEYRLLSGCYFTNINSLILYYTFPVELKFHAKIIG